MPFARPGVGVGSVGVGVGGVGGGGVGGVGIGGGVGMSGGLGLTPPNGLQPPQLTPRVLIPPQMAGTSMGGVGFGSNKPNLPAKRSLTRGVKQTHGKATF